VRTDGDSPACTTSTLGRGCVKTILRIIWAQN
jgi:hypothetical protein